MLAGFANPGHSIEQEFLKSLGRSVTAGANFLFLNAVSAASVAALVNGLQSLNRKTERAMADLGDEREALLLTKEKLKQEIAVRRDSEKALQQRERLYRTLAENIKDVIWTMDLNFRFTYVSPATQALQGWAVEELLELRLDDILKPGSLDRIYEEFQKETAIAAQTGSYRRSTTLELELMHKDGTTVWAEVTASFLLGEDGRPVGVLGVTRDITERNRAQREKEKLLESLSQSKKMEAIGRLAGGVAHDLNNVLSGIVSYPDLLLLDLPAESPLRRPIETIQESGKRAAAIVQDLLTLARRGVSVSEVVNLNEVAREYLTSPEFQRMKSFHPLVTIMTRLDPGLLNILGSPVHLSKTIMNLVSNAAEAMPEGGRSWLPPTTPIWTGRSPDMPRCGKGNIRFSRLWIRVSASRLKTSTGFLNPSTPKRRWGAAERVWAWRLSGGRLRITGDISIFRAPRGKGRRLPSTCPAPVRRRPPRLRPTGWINIEVGVKPFWWWTI